MEPRQAEGPEKPEAEGPRRSRTVVRCPFHGSSTDDTVPGERRRAVAAHCSGPTIPALILTFPKYMEDWD